MRYVRMDAVEPGMQLAKRVYNEGNEALLHDNTPLSKEYIEKLKERGYAGVYIQDALSADIEIEEAISEELRMKAVDNFNQMDVDGMVESAGDIVNQLSDRPIISLDMMDLRAFDDYTARHCVNVAVISTIVGMGLGLSKSQLEDLCAAGLLHDIGKQKVPKEILNKPGKFTEEEREIMNSHPKYSFELLRDKYDISAVTKNAVLCHHENYDGSGYPNGFSGSHLHLYAKILRVVDTYDAMVSERVYKKAYSPSDVIEYLMGGCSIMFDPGVVKAFIKYVPAYPKGSNVKLSDGRDAIVVDNSEKYRLRPKVRVITGETLDLAEDESLRSLTIVGVSFIEEATQDEILSGEKERYNQKHHILVVDDMVSDLHILKGILEESYKVTLVKSGRQALDFIDRCKRMPDLILMDVEMPEMDGIETVTRIRMRGKDVPVMFITSKADKETVTACRQLNAKDYIIKPYKPVYILERIFQAIGD